MAINKKLVHFKTFAKFNEELSAGNILDTSICWIKDTKQIWTHGQFYDCSSLTDEDIVGTALVGYAESVETNENLDLTAEDTIVEAFGKLVKAIKDNEEVDSAAFVKLRDSVGLDENLGFSTSAGDSNVTEAIERIDGKIISTGDGTKFLADNGQYLVAGGAVDVTDIFNRLVNLPQPEPQCTDEDYNALKKYALNGVVTYINDNNDTGAVTHINYLSGTITIWTESFEDDRELITIITIKSNKVVNMEYSYIPYLTGVGKGFLGLYTKQSAYSAITEGDSISKAIGKLEANVEKITVSGDGTKFLADDGTYKNAGGTQYLDLSMFSAESGTLSDEDYQKVVKAYENGINLFSYKLTESANLFSHGSLSINDIEGEYVIIVSFIMSYGVNSIVKNHTIIINSNKSYSLASGSVLLAADGSGTKALTNNGQYADFAKPITSVSGSSGTVTQELSPNTYYKFSRCTSLTITLGAEVPGILNEYMFEFLSGATPTVLNLPETVKWNNGNAPTIEANKKYIVSIISNIAVIGGA